MHKKPKGKLMIIGGAEKGDRDHQVLEVVAKEALQKQKSILIVTAASYESDPTEYISIFKDLGLRQIEVLEIPDRDTAQAKENGDKVAKAGTIFFTGGDQLRITSQVGDSLVYRELFTAYLEGALIAGTSAGAAAMPTTMIIGGPSDESNRISTLSMAPGLGLLEGVVIDSHFAERGRMGRLLGAVAQNPRNLGLGIDEGTAILVRQGEQFQVIGPGAVYVLDGSDISYSSLSEDNIEGVVSIHDVKVHVLGCEDRFDLVTRRPHAKATKHAPAS
jgi:cyanophycinase